MCSMPLAVFLFSGSDVPTGMSPGLTCLSFPPGTLSTGFFFYPHLIVPLDNPMACAFEAVGDSFPKWCREARN